MSSKRLILGMLVLVCFAYQNCGQGFNSATSPSDNNNANYCASCNPNPNPNPGPGPGPNPYPAFNLSAALTIIAEIMASFTAPFGLGGSCVTFGACSGTGPSSESVNFNCSNSGTTITGTTPITFNGPSCSVIQSTQIGARPALSIAGGGETLQVSSSNAMDYRGNSIGNGFTANYSLTSISLLLQGINITGSGAASVDFSARSVSALTGALSLSPLQVSVTGGPLEIIDNSAHAYLSLSVNNITFQQGCSCPISGSLSGSLSSGGSVSLTFTSTCGLISVTAPGINNSITVSTCSI